MAIHILERKISEDATELQLLLFDDSTNQAGWIKTSINLERPMTFKK